MKTPNLFSGLRDVPEHELHGATELKRRELNARRDRVRERQAAIERERRQYELVMRRCGGDPNARIVDYSDAMWDGVSPWEGPWPKRADASREVDRRADEERRMADRANRTALAKNLRESSRLLLGTLANEKHIEHVAEFLTAHPGEFADAAHMSVDEFLTALQSLQTQCGALLGRMAAKSEDVP